MVDRVVEQFSKFRDAFADMRTEMRNNQKYSGNVAAADKLYGAIRRFAYEMGLAPPFIPLDPDDDRG
jgi:hypothetical protein